MKKIKNLLLAILGLIFIAFSVKLLIIDKSDKYAQIIGGVVFGLLMIYPSFKKDATTDVEKFVEKENIEIVIWWKRLLVFLIDFVILTLIYSTTMSLINLLFEIRLDKLYDPLIVFSPFVVFYYTIQEYLFQTTIGKLPFKLKVVSTKSNAFVKTEAGSNPTFFQVLIRSLTRLLFAIDIFFFLFKRPIGLHDIISKTIVIKK
mgnify:CR=1 FL=1|jgi:uncharacterized RDD family membrane protein YckC|tara:strand:+ start:197 stop:805 length:609 start_codon:yes stop_codon:yes gene_type:complete